MLQFRCGDLGLMDRSRMHIFVRFGKDIEHMCIMHLCGDLGFMDRIGYVYRCVDFKLMDRVCLARLCYDLRNIRIARLLRVYIVICKFICLMWRAYLCSKLENISIAYALYTCVVI